MRATIKLKGGLKGDKKGLRSAKNFDEMGDFCDFERMNAVSPYLILMEIWQVLFPTFKKITYL